MQSVSVGVGERMTVFGMSSQDLSSLKSLCKLVVSQSEYFVKGCLKTSSGCWSIQFPMVCDRGSSLMFPGEGSQCLHITASFLTQFTNSQCELVVIFKASRESILENLVLFAKLSDPSRVLSLLIIQSRVFL